MQAKKKPTQKDGKKKTSTDEAKKHSFFVYPQKVELQSHQKVYAFITAFPDTPGEYKDVLRIAVQHNPKVLQLNVQCKAV